MQLGRTQGGGLRLVLACRWYYPKGGKSVRIIDTRERLRDRPKLDERFRCAWRVKIRDGKWNQQAGAKTTPLRNLPGGALKRASSRCALVR